MAYEAAVTAVSFDKHGTYEGILWSKVSHSAEESFSMVFNDICRLSEDFEVGNGVVFRESEDCYGVPVFMAEYGDNGFITYYCSVMNSGGKC